MTQSAAAGATEDEEPEQRWGSRKSDLTDTIRSAMWSRIINLGPGPVKSILPLF